MQVFEVDEETGLEEDVNTIQKEGVTKRGWLYKAPAYGVSSISIRVRATHVKNCLTLILYVFRLVLFLFWMKISQHLKVFLKSFRRMSFHLSCAWGTFVEMLQQTGREICCNGL